MTKMKKILAIGLAGVLAVGFAACSNGGTQEAGNDDAATTAAAAAKTGYAVTASLGLTKALAKEEGPSGITVNCVAPGVIETDMMAAFTAEDKAALAEETPVGRLGTPEEVAKLLVFLADEDAGYITGQVFGVNGGLVI